VFDHGLWRPHRQHLFPVGLREATRTVCILARAADTVDEHGVIASHYEAAYLHLLPEELIQEIYAYLTLAPVSTAWLAQGRSVCASVKID
jgi:hypothetical protein